jgi:hypothetical protein
MSLIKMLLTTEGVSFLSMLVALAAVIVGPIVTFKVAKRQIVSPIRQKWIDELREILSEFLSECRKAIILYEGTGLLNAENMDNELFRKLLYLEQKLVLMLNPHEADHIELTNIVKDITDNVQHGVDNFIEFGEKLAEATDLSQQILKKEWKRVKNGDI